MTARHQLAVKVLNLCSSEAAGSQEDTVRCKFVLIEWADEIHLVFGPVSQYRYHANLVERFCARYRVPSGWEQRPDRYALYAAGMRVRGGGYLQLDFVRRRLEVSGRSTAYGAYNESMMGQVLAAPGVFEGWHTVESEEG